MCYCAFLCVCAQIEMFLRFVAYGSAFFVLFNIIDLGLVSSFRAEKEGRERERREGGGGNSNFNQY